tara:strand:+ start:878 stop:1369 length:492 start_codon:yes stop_codon:yes gene_type:complete
MSAVWVKLEVIQEHILNDGSKTTSSQEGLIKFSSLMNDSRIVFPYDTAWPRGDAERTIGRAELHYIGSISNENLMKISREQLKIKIGEWSDGAFRKTSIEVENVGKLDADSFKVGNGVEVNIGEILRCRITYFDGHFANGVHPHGDILFGIPDKSNWISSENN